MQYSQRKLGSSQGTLSYLEAQRLEAQRSKRAIEEDLRKKALTRFPANLPDYSTWARDPAHSDVVGIDFIPPRGKSKLLQSQQQEVQNKQLPPQRPEVLSRQEFEQRQREIQPFIRREYAIWSSQHPGKKKLSMLGLQRYYDSREAAFEAEGGSSIAFKEAFDKLDFGVASDSWHDLDPELKKLNILGSVPYSPSEERRQARKAAREEKQISDLYEQYLNREERRHASAG